MTKHGTSSIKKKRTDVIDVKSSQEPDSDASSDSGTESEEDNRHHHKKPLQPAANKRSKREEGASGGGGGCGSTKKKHGGGGAATVDLAVLAQAVQAEPSLSKKIEFLFCAVQDQVLPQLSYVHGELKRQAEEDAEQARLEEKARRRAAKQEGGGGGGNGKKRRKQCDSDDEKSSEEEEATVAQGKRKGGKDGNGKKKVGKGKSKSAFIPIMDKWSKQLAAKLEQNGILGQVPFNKERHIIVREHYSISIDDSEALFEPTGTLLQPTKHNKPHSALYVYKFWGKEVSQLFSPLPFPLKRKARLFTKEGAALAAAAAQAKKEERDKKKKAKKAEEGGGDDDDDDDDQSSKGGGSDNEEAEASSGGGGSKREGGGKKGWEDDGEATLKTVNVKITSMEARHNHDKLGLSLVFFFEQAEPSEGAEESEED